MLIIICLSRCTFYLLFYFSLLLKAYFYCNECYLDLTRRRHLDFFFFLECFLFCTEEVTLPMLATLLKLLTAPNCSRLKLLNLHVFFFFFYIIFACVTPFSCYYVFAYVAFSPIFIQSSKISPDFGTFYL